MRREAITSAIDSRSGAGLSPAQQRRGMRYIYLGSSAGAVLIMLLIRSGFGTLFIKHLGGSDGLAMLLGATVGFARIVQIPVSLRVHPANGKKFMLRCWTVYALTMAAAAFFPVVMGIGASTARAVVLTVFVAVAIGQSGFTFWFPILHDTIPADSRGRFIGKMRAWWSTSVFVAIVAAGLFLGKSPATWRFQVVIVVAASLVMLRNYFVSRIPVVAESGVDQDDFGDWRKHISNLLRRKDVLIFCGYFAIVGLCIGFLGQPLVLYMRYMGFPTNENIIITGFTMLGTILALLIGGQLVDRIGTKRVFVATHLLLCVVCFSAVGIGMLPRNQARFLMPAALILAGAARAGGFLACTTQLFHLTPDRGRAFFLCLANILIFVGPSAAPLVAGGVLSAVSADWSTTVAGVELNVFQIMLGLSGLTLLAALTLLRFVKDIRHTPRFPQ